MNAHTPHDFGDEAKIGGSFFFALMRNAYGKAERNRRKKQPNLNKTPCNVEI